MRKINIGIVGLGRVASKTHIPVLKSIEYVEVVSGAEKNPERAERVKQLYKLRTVYTDYEEMYAAEKLDAVYVCLPHHLHADATKKALERGIHVLCEKPMGMSPEEAADVTALAERRGLVLMPGYKMRYAKNYAKAKEMIDAGLIGQILQVQGTLLAPGPYIAWDPKSDWYLDGESHGAIYDLGCHLVDILLYLVPGEVRTVHAFSRKGFVGYDAPTSVTCIFEMEGGIVGDLAIGWRAANDVQTFSVHGTAGSITVNRERLSYVHPGTDQVDRILEHAGNTRGEVWALLNKIREKLSSNNFYVEDLLQARAFIDAVHGIRPAPINGRDATNIHKFLRMITLSS
jgi:predicted dehydrogenase